MKAVKRLMGLMAVGVMLCGCTPDETFVLVKASELKKAASGQLGTAKVEMAFSIHSEEDRELPNKIRRAALPYLGEGAVIEVEKTEKRKVRTGGSIRDEEEEEVDNSLDGAKLVARFNIPVGTEEVIGAGESIMWLKYRESDKTFLLVNGNNVAALNSALARVNDSVEYEYNGGSGSSVTIKVANDAEVVLGVAAVEVNGQKLMAGSVGTSKVALKINYDNEFYSELAPCFVYGGIKGVRSEICKKQERSVWDD